MNRTELLALIEAILFISPEAITLEEISEQLRIKKYVAQGLLEELAVSFVEQNRGLRVIIANDTYKMATKPELEELLVKIAGRTKESTLSAACIETLTIIAYKQPITRHEIDKIRGVGSDKTLSTLLSKGLIRHSGRLDSPGKPFLYKTTDEFLRFFSLKSIKDLPSIV